MVNYDSFMVTLSAVAGASLLVKIWHDAAGIKKLSVDMLSPGIRILLSGVAIGLGSGPVHKIIAAIQSKREKKEKNHSING